MRFAQPDGPKFEEELGDFENALSRERRTHPAVFSTKTQTFYKEDNE
jgi:hypothetical protein